MHIQFEGVVEIFIDKTPCSECSHLADCAPGKQGWRTVTCNEHGDIYDEAERVFKANKRLYKLRQQIVEHPLASHVNLI